jgi:hypothetical protein
MTRPGTEACAGASRPITNWGPGAGYGRLQPSREAHGIVRHRPRPMAATTNPDMLDGTVDLAGQTGPD